MTLPVVFIIIVWVVVISSVTWLLSSVYEKENDGDS
jgi:hypothetical protein